MSLREAKTGRCWFEDLSVILYVFPQDTKLIKRGKSATFQGRNMGNINKTKLLTLLVVGWVDIVCPLKWYTEENTASCLWDSYQDSMIWVWSLMNIRQTEVPGHPIDVRSVFFMNF